jgi:hypothetical protein
MQDLMMELAEPLFELNKSEEEKSGGGAAAAKDQVLPCEPC